MWWLEHLQSRFADPLWLLALPLVPILCLWRWRARSGAGRARLLLLGTLRGIAVACLLVALAGPLAPAPGGHPELVFVLDRSSSIGPQTSRRALALINTAFEHLPESTRAGVVVFGADAAVQTAPSERPPPILALETDVSTEGTNLQRALQLGMSSFSAEAGTQRRLVLLSDGRANQGEVREALALARSTGVQIFTVALHRDDALEEVYVDSLGVPAQVGADEPYELRVNVASDHRERVHLLVTRDGELIVDRSVSLVPGIQTFTFAQTVASAGLYEYQAVINARRDRHSGNNSARAFVRVLGGPRVLHLAASTEWGRYVSEALRAQGFSVEERAASAMPASLQALADYQLVILNNVSAFDLSLSRLALLEEYVRNAGGGLMVLGGDKSFSAGGYQDTPLERALPVSMDVRTQVLIPTLAVVILIDRSGSMSSQAGSETKLDIAKDAAFASIALLSNRDKVGVLAFDAEPEWVLEPVLVEDPLSMAPRLAELGAGGGTDLHVALTEAWRVLRNEPAKLKHLIVLSDGLTEGASDFTALLEQLKTDGITLSAVAFGKDANQVLLAGLAQSAGGRYYHTDDPANVPRIFTSETMVVARGLIVEKSVQPSWRAPGDPIKGFEQTEFPPLEGYQLTFARPQADVLLDIAAEEPLLVSWRYGLGKSVVFASDLSARWGRHWIQWTGFERFLAQTARWTMRRQGGERLLPEFRVDANQVELTVDALDAEEQFINDMRLEATVVDELRHTQQLSLAQIAPGRYQGRFETTRSGRYYVTLSDAAGSSRIGPATYGLALPVSDELVHTGADRASLAAIADASGGRLLALAESSLSVLFEPSRSADGGRQQRHWWPWMLTALALLLIELGLRKLALPARWWQRLRRGSKATLDQEPAEPSQAELLGAIAQARDAHLRRLDVGEHRRRELAANPTERARLYVSGGRR
ncbi:MAG: VWA domain-containing protein [Gammaproteobacteria bacterium]|nr:VWA domain-containing protein [Gammaproteobacteria bacterium]